MARTSVEREVIADDLASLHHEPDALELADVGERIAGNGDEIGVTFGGLRMSGLAWPVLRHT
jgi:hypothetical protein